MNINIKNIDCLDGMKALKDNSIDLVFTSPPYADRRKDTYGGPRAVDYCEWFRPIAKEIFRILKPTGSFFLNIKPHTEGGERDLYVFDLIIMLKREIGFRFIDELCWTKRAYPGKLQGRLKNGFEPIYHFSRSRPSEIKFNPLACGEPIKPESLARARRKKNITPDNGSNMTTVKGDNLMNITIARPSNVINIHNVTNQFSSKSKHPAVFPEGLAEFFIKTFSDEGDAVLDPFMGSGTTGVSSKKLNRDFAGFELMPDYFILAESRINDQEVSNETQIDMFKVN